MIVGLKNVKWKKVMKNEMKYDIDENVIQWLNGEKYITCMFTQKKYINKVKKIAQRTPEFVLDLIENNDGSFTVSCH